MDSDKKVHELVIKTATIIIYSMLSLLRVYKQNAFANYGLFATLNNKLSRKIPYATSIVKHVLHYVDLHNENEV